MTGTVAVRTIIAKATKRVTEQARQREVADIYPKPGNVLERGLTVDLYRLFSAQLDKSLKALRKGPKLNLSREILAAARQSIAMLSVRNEDARRYYMAQPLKIGGIRADWLTFVDGMQSLSARQKAKLKEQIAAIGAGGKLAKAPPEPPPPEAVEPLRDWQAGRAATPLAIIIEMERAEDISELLRRTMLVTARQAGRGVVGRIGLPSFALRDERALEWLEGYTFRLSQRTAHGYETAVKKLVISRIDEGLGGRELTENIKWIIDPVDAKGRPKPASRLRYEAERIARTETHRARIFGAIEAANESGLAYMQWQTAGVNLRTGREVCWRCAPMDGKIIPVSAAIVGVTREYPGLIPVHPACRCSLIPVTRPATESADAFLDDAQIAEFRQSVAESDPSVHPFSTEATEVKRITAEQQNRVSRLQTINRRLRTRGGAVGEKRKELQAERAKLKAESRRHLERRLEELKEAA